MFQSLPPPSRIISRGDHVPGFLAGGVRDRQSTDPRTSRQCGGAQRGRRCAKGGAASATAAPTPAQASMGPGTRVRNVSRTGRHSSPVTPVCSFRLCQRPFRCLSIPNIPRYLRSVWFPKRPRSSFSAKDRGVIPGFRMRINWSRAGTLLSELGCSRPEQPAPAEYTPAWQDNPE